MIKKSSMILFVMLLVLCLFTACEEATPVFPGSVNGFIVDSETWLPVQDASVSIGGKTVKTNSSGYYYVDGLEPGIYSISCYKNGYLTNGLTDVNLMISADEIVDITSQIASYTSNRDGSSLDLKQLKHGVSANIISLSPTNNKLVGCAVAVYGTESLGLIPAGTKLQARYVQSEVLDSLRGYGMASSDSSILSVLTSGESLVYTTTVEDDGSFVFTNIPNGYYVITNESFSIQQEGSTYCFGTGILYDAMAINTGALVSSKVFESAKNPASIYVTVVTTKAPVKDVLARENIEVVASAELDANPILSANIPNGGALKVTFNKPLDETKPNKFALYSQSNKIFVGSEFKIYNTEEKGIVYVWSDKIQLSVDDIQLKYSVYGKESWLVIEDETCDSFKTNDYLTVMAANMYDYNTSGVMYEKAAIDICPTIYFDKNIPSGAIITATLLDSFQNEVDILMPIYDGNEITISPEEMLEYNSTYYLALKVTTAAGQFLYNTDGSLTSDKISGVLNSATLNERSYIKFSTDRGIRLTASNLYDDRNGYPGIQPDEKLLFTISHDYNSLSLVTSSSNASLVGADGNIINCSLSKSGSTLVISPNANMSEKVSYTLRFSATFLADGKLVTVSTGDSSFRRYLAKKDAIEVNNTGISFTCGLKDLSVVNSNIVLNGTDTQNFSATSAIEIQFDKNMSEYSTATLKTYVNETVNVPFNLSANGNKIIITPSGTLFPGKVYNFTLVAKDEYGRTKNLSARIVVSDTEIISGAGNFAVTTSGNYDSATNQNVALSWSKGDSSGSYYVYSQKSGGNWERISSIQNSNTSINTNLANAIMAMDLVDGKSVKFAVLTETTNGLLYCSNIVEIKDTVPPVMTNPTVSPSLVFNTPYPVETTCTIRISTQNHEKLKTDSTSYQVAKFNMDNITMTCSFENNWYNNEYYPDTLCITLTIPAGETIPADSTTNTYGMISVSFRDSNGNQTIAKTFNLNQI